MFPYANLMLTYLEREISGISSTAQGRDEPKCWKTEVITFISLGWDQALCIQTHVHVLFPLHATRKIPEEKDILLGLPFTEFHGPPGDIEPPYSFSLHIN